MVTGYRSAQRGARVYQYNARNTSIKNVRNRDLTDTTPTLLFPHEENNHGMELSIMISIKLTDEQLRFILPHITPNPRILVTGERIFEVSVPIWYALAVIYATAHEHTPTLIHGGARGADKLAAYIGAVYGFHVDAYSADWEQYGRAAGPIRNQQMLKKGKPNLVVAFFVDRIKSKGTNHMVKISKEAGITCLIWEENKGWSIE